MADTHETIADIIAKMRKTKYGDAECEVKWCLTQWADRLEAAHKRERGDCAKLREVCEKMLDLLTAEGFEDGGMSIELDEKQVIMWRNRFRAALSAPPRNCDRPECAITKAAQDMWRKEDGGKTAYHEWLLATTTEQEGGAK